MLKYQLDHLNRRLSDVANKKKLSIQKECNEAVKVFENSSKYQEEWGQYYALLHIIERYRFESPPMRSFNRAKVTGYGFQGRDGINLVKLAGLEGENKKRAKANDAAIRKIGSKFQKRSQKVDFAKDKIYDSLVLDGAEEFEKALAAFSSMKF